MTMYDLIEKKKRGKKLTAKEIGYLVTEYTNGAIPDYQMSAFLMAVCLRGMDRAETLALTKAMRDSGDRLDLSALGGLAADKHSTGGVGDKTSLIVCPIAASLGLKIAKMSGRGLGHTGGTIDKLESIDGFQTTLSPEAFFEQVQTVGMAIIGQSRNLAPADKKIYALRDLTATVDSIPLIASSIMSKKLAAGADVIVLDVKVGSGAFMKTKADAKELAAEMVEIGRGCGKKVRAVLSNMDVPLGSAVGNALEVAEAVRILRGEEAGDLLTICLELAANMVSLAKHLPIEEARREAAQAVVSGRALEVFRRWMTAQGAKDLAFIDDPEKLCPAKYERTVCAKESGYLRAMNAEQIGKAAALLGAGREKLEDAIDPSAGILLFKKTGDFVAAGDTLAVLKTSSRASFEEAEAPFLDALRFGETKPKAKPLIYGIV